jgi:hypothetical protein
MTLGFRMILKEKCLLWLIDRRRGEPNAEEDEDEYVDHSPDYIQLPQEFGGLHGQKTLDNQQQEENQIEMPGFLDIATRESISSSSFIYKKCAHTLHGQYYPRPES